MLRWRGPPVLDDLQRLIDLQKLDEQLVALEEESAGLPGRRAERAETREASQQRVVAAKEALQEAENEQRRVESALQDQEALIQKLEGQQFQVKTNEAYTALLREMEQARQAISDSETSLLEAMDAIEAGGLERAAAEEEAEKVLGRVAADEKALDAREHELAALIAELREALPHGSRLLFERIYERTGGDTLAEVVPLDRGGVKGPNMWHCGACNYNVRPQAVVEIINHGSLMHCDSCKRLLFIEESES